MPQPSFQPRIYAADSHVWYGEPPSAGKRGCAFTILLLIAIIWRDSIHHEIAKTAVIFFLLAFLVWVLLPGISTGHPLAVCDIEGLTFSCGKKIRYQWRWQDLKKVSVISASGKPFIIVHDIQGQAITVRTGRLSLNSLREIAAVAANRLAANGLPSENTITVAPLFPAGKTYAPAAENNVVPPSTPVETITPHIWYMNASLVRTANAYLAMSMNIFIIAPIFLLMSWELLRGLSAVIGVLICLIGMGRTAWYCGWVYYHFFGRNRIRIFAEADNDALSLYPLGEPEFYLQWAEMAACEYVAAGADDKTSSALLITDRDGAQYVISSDNLGDDEMLDEIAAYTQAVLRGKPLVLPKEAADAHPQHASYLAAWLNILKPFVFIALAALNMLGAAMLLYFILFFVGMLMQYEER